MNSPDLKRLLNLALSTVGDAIHLLMQDMAGNRQVCCDLLRDVKIVADQHIENYIIQELSKESGYPILSEESGSTGGFDSSRIQWIIDPIDGSLNFSRGIPISCISIGLWREMEPLLGVICDFNRGETLSGIVGHGAWLNGLPIHVSDIQEKAKAILCTGFPSKSDFSSGYLSDFIHDLQNYKKVRLLGSAALSLAYVACGRVDCYRENSIHLWDIAGGIALVKSAGGFIRVEQSDDKHLFNVIASNSCLIF